MGALASIIRAPRDDSCRTLVPFDQSHGHISKKPRVSGFADRDTPGYKWFCFVLSRIWFYPDSKPGFSREVHAPGRILRFATLFDAKKVEGSGSFEESSTGKMGNCLCSGSRYDKAKNGARKSSRYIWKDDESFTGKEKENLVIEIDDGDEEKRSDDSSIEEVEIVDVLGKQKIKMIDKDMRSLNSSVVTDLSNENEKVDGAEKLMGVTQLDQEPDDLAVLAHKRLYDFTKRRDGKLNELDQEIEYNEKLLQRIQLLGSQEKGELIKKDVLEECFLPLNEEEEDLVDRALSISNRRKVLVSHENSNIDITGEILRCLGPGAWLNDEVANLYLELLKEREKRQPHKFLKCHFFNTFFYKKLTAGRDGYDFQSVRRWTTQRKLGYSLFDCDKIFVPVHMEIHWRLAIINKKDKKFQYLDSLKEYDIQVLNVLARYYVDEVKDKNGKDIDVSSWEKELVTDLPEQHNRFDCGMFMVKYADFHSRGIGLCFNQDHLPYFRRRIVKEILQLRAD